MAYDDLDITESTINDLPKNPEKDNLAICTIIQANIQDEADAARKYFQLLEYLTDENDIDTVKEIISDELNHAEKLREMVLSYSGIEPAKD